MAAPGAARIVDVSEVHLRTAMVRAGVWLTYGVCVAGGLYLAFTWQQPHRTSIAILLGIAVVGAVAIQSMPIGRIVRGPLAEPFFVVWSVADIALISIMVTADGGVTSPFAGVFFVPMVFAALFYPLRLFVPVGVLVVFGYIGATAFGGSTADPTVVALVTTALAIVAVMCAWQAQYHDRTHAVLSRISRTDPLTDTLNRRGFEELVEAELAEATRTGPPVALIMLDLDGFKLVNDSRGHVAGDELLEWVAGCVEGVVRPMDSVGRLGGDEFAVLAPGTSKAEAREMEARIAEALAERVAVTSGVACAPEDGRDSDELYRVADRELYVRKHGGLVNGAGDRDMDWARTLGAAVSARIGGSLDESPAARYAAGLARRLGWHGGQLERVRLAAMVHDIGKLPVPDRILHKPGPLEPAEYEEVKFHLVHGAEMLGRVDGLGPVASWLRHAHENWDGSGYPEGLQGDAIPLPARMLRVVSAYNAMTSDRPYRAALPSEQAVEQLRRNAGCQFDPRCVEEFEAYLLGEPVPAEPSGLIR